MCTGMSCFGRVLVVVCCCSFVLFSLKGSHFWKLFQVGMYIFQCHVPLRSALLLGLCFNEVSRDEGNGVVVLQNTQRHGSSPVAGLGEPLCSPQCSQKSWHRPWLVNKPQLNTAQSIQWYRLLGELETHSAQTKPTRAKDEINHLCCLNNFQGYHPAAFRAECSIFAGGWIIFCSIRTGSWLEL